MNGTVVLQQRCFVIHFVFQKLGTTLRPNETHHRAHFLFAHLAEILLADHNRHAFGRSAFFVGGAAYGQHRLGGHLFQTVFLADLACHLLHAPAQILLSQHPQRQMIGLDCQAGFHIFGGAFFGENGFVRAQCGGEQIEIARAQAQPHQLMHQLFGRRRRQLAQIAGQRSGGFIFIAKLLVNLIFGERINFLSRHGRGHIIGCAAFPAPTVIIVFRHRLIDMRYPVITLVCSFPLCSAALRSRHLGRPCCFLCCAALLVAHKQQHQQQKHQQHN